MIIQHSSETLQYCIQNCVSRYELGPREDRNPSTCSICICDVSMPCDCHNVTTCMYYCMHTSMYVCEKSHHVTYLGKYFLRTVYEVDSLLLSVGLVFLDPYSEYAYPIPYSNTY